MAEVVTTSKPTSTTVAPIAGDQSSKSGKGKGPKASAARKAARALVAGVVKAGKAVLKAGTKAAAKASKAGKAVVKSLADPSKKLDYRGQHRGYRTSNPIKPEGVKMASAAKPVLARVVTREARSGALRADYRTLAGVKISKSALLRWCGYVGYTYAQAAQLVTRLGMPATEGNIRCQTGDGSRYAADPKAQLAYTTTEGMQALIQAITRADKAELDRLAGPA